MQFIKLEKLCQRWFEVWGEWREGSSESSKSHRGV